MAVINRYVLVDRKGNEQEWEYERFDEAKDAAIEDHEEYAVIEREYEYSDSALVWTPDGSDTWPPNRR